jgi:hypothetical protein
MTAIRRFTRTVRATRQIAENVSYERGRRGSDHSVLAKNRSKRGVVAGKLSAMCDRLPRSRRLAILPAAVAAIVPGVVLLTTRPGSPVSDGVAGLIVGVMLGVSIASALALRSSGGPLRR